MADSKITALTALTAADPVNDVFPIVDVSDTTMAASGTTKKISVNNILGASGTATLASATITGALVVDTTTLVVDATNNRVGIGTASPADSLHVYGSGNALIEGTAGLYTRTNYKVVAKTWQVGYRSGTTQFEIQEDLTERFVIANGGNVGVGVTPVAGNGAIQLSAGVGFPSTQVASANANTLDDYEEGTWTGTLTGSTTNPTVAVTATGRYTKIGRVVTVQIFYSNVSTVGASGAIAITGLPFANSTVQSVGSVSLYQIGTFTGSTFAIIDSSNSSIEFNANISGATYGSVTHNAGIARYMTTSITYTVA